MRVVIQRVSHASVTIDGHCKSAIQKGMMILVGIEETDSREDIDWLCKKIVNLRIFDDENGVMNQSLKTKVTYWLLVNSHYMRLLKKEIVHPT